MATFDLYGLESATLDAAREAIESALGITMVAHESGYHAGAYYRLGHAGSEHFILQRNFDDFEQEWAEPTFKDSSYVLYVNETLRAPELEARLVGAIRLLRRQDL